MIKSEEGYWSERLRPSPGTGGKCLRHGETSTSAPLPSRPQERRSLIKRRVTFCWPVSSSPIPAYPHIARTAVIPIPGNPHRLGSRRTYPGSANPYPSSPVPRPTSGCPHELRSRSSRNSLCSQSRRRSRCLPYGGRRWWCKARLKGQYHRRRLRPVGTLVQIGVSRLRCTHHACGYDTCRSHNHYFSSFHFILQFLTVRSSFLPDEPCTLTEFTKSSMAY